MDTEGWFQQLFLFPKTKKDTNNLEVLVCVAEMKTLS